MNKKIISLIIGILLIIIGLVGWNYLNKENNLDEQVLEDVKLNNAELEQETEVETVEQKEKFVPLKTKTTKKVEAPKPSNKVIVDTSEPEIEEAPVFEEAISEEKELTNPYVDENGNIVVIKEFRQPLKQKVRYRGSVYNIKIRESK